MVLISRGRGKRYTRVVMQRRQTPLPITKDVLAHMKQADPVLYKILAPYHGDVLARIVPKHTNKELFAALIHSIISQQLSIKAAAHIQARVTEACGGAVTPEVISGISETTLRACGLSGAKVKTVQALARAVETKELKLLSLRKASTDEAMEALTKIWGIGPWTAQMFLIFSLGAPDVFSARDLILRRAVETVHKLPPDSPIKTIEDIALAWSPYRTYVSLFFWQEKDKMKAYRN